MRKISVLIILSILLLTGCNDKKEQVTFYTISSKEASELMESNNSAIILDVRSKSEYEEGHLDNAINMEYGLIEKHFKDEVTDNLESVIIVYCQSGARAEIAANELIELGYKNVFTFGGINSWEYDIVK